MGGLVIDIAVFFIFKSARRVYYFLRSRGWSRNRAIITGVTLIAPDFGCPFVRVGYQMDDKSYLSGEDEIPFFLRRSAKAYMQSCTINSQVIIRVNPINLAENYLFSHDQRIT